MGTGRSCSCSSHTINTIFPFPFPPPPPPHRLLISPPNKFKRRSNISFAAAATFSLPKRCQKCGGKGAIDCPGCKVSTLHSQINFTKFNALPRCTLIILLSFIILISFVWFLQGTGKNKKNGNIFERWKSLTHSIFYFLPKLILIYSSIHISFNSFCFRCFECQGFGLKSCPECGNGGLTPEQRGERWCKHTSLILPIFTSIYLIFVKELRGGKFNNFPPFT